MEKKALLVYGKPNEQEMNNEKLKGSFVNQSRKNISIMTEIALKEKYDIEIGLFDNAIKKIKSYQNLDNFLFYFTGHANGHFIGNSFNTLDNFFNSITKIDAEKLIILDACTEEYLNKNNFPKNTKVISAHEVYDNKSIAKLLYDEVILRKRKLDDIGKKSFDEMKHNWVYFKEGK